MKHFVRFVIVALAGLALFGATSAAPAAAGPRMSDTLAAGSGYFAVGERHNRDGTVTDTFANSAGALAAVSSAAGATVTIGDVSRPNHEGVVVHMPQVSITVTIDKTNGLRNAAAYAAAGRSVVADAIALGMDPVAAQRIFGHLMVLDTRSSSTANAGLLGLATPRAPSAPTRSASPIEWSGCQRSDSSDGHVHEYGCDVQYLDQQNGGDWYLVDQQQASGWSDQADCCWADRVSVVREWLLYSANNVLVRWNPGGTQTEPSSCNQVTVSITGQSGIGYSQTETICKDNFGPLNLQGTPAQFGSIWNGLEPGQNWYEGTAADDLVHSPSNAADSLTFSGNASWKNPFCC